MLRGHLHRKGGGPPFGATPQPQSQQSASPATAGTPVQAGEEAGPGEGPSANGGSAAQE